MTHNSTHWAGVRLLRGIIPGLRLRISCTAILASDSFERRGENYLSDWNQVSCK
jgi:hypothetical protein